LPRSPLPPHAMDRDTAGLSSLYRAVLSDDADAVRAVLASGVSPDGCLYTPGDDSTLATACRLQTPVSLTIIRALMRAGATIDTHTVHTAAIHDRLDALQLFMSSGADGYAFDKEDRSTQVLARLYGAARTADWLDQHIGSHPLQIAALCRLSDDASRALALGRFDPVHCCSTTGEMMRTRRQIRIDSHTAAGKCAATTKFVNLATGSWSPQSHWMYTHRVRAAVHTVLLTAHRLLASSSCQPILPPEMWRCVLACLRRSDYTP
jgi:hypothetical protein